MSTGLQISSCDVGDGVDSDCDWLKSSLLRISVSGTKKQEIKLTKIKTSSICINE